MGIFFGSPKPTLRVIETALEDALLKDPNELTDPKKEAALRTLGVAETSEPPFYARRFGGAVVISLALVLAAVWTAQHNLNDISKGLMDSFAGFSGLVLGLLGGEAQKT
jgi:hypothetical protein